MEEFVETQEDEEQTLTEPAVAADFVEMSNIQPQSSAKWDEWYLEKRYIERAAAYFGNWLNDLEVISPAPLTRAFEKRMDASLTPDEIGEMLLLDVILYGKTRPPAPMRKIYVALEVAVTVQEQDVMQASARAALLRRTGVRVVAAVGGKTIDPTAAAAAKIHAVAVVLERERQGWEEALAASQS